MNHPERRIQAIIPPSLWVPILLFPLFWFFRSASFRGDGDQIARMIEGGVWFWLREMLSMAILQATYQGVRLLHWNGMMTLNLVSCLSGCLFYSFLIRLAQDRWGNWRLPVLLFLGSGFTILFCGHTEFYPITFAVAAIFFWSSHAYLQGKGSLFWPTFWFSILCWTHLLGFFITPVLIYLWWAGGHSEDDFTKGILGLTPLIGLYIFIFYNPLLVRMSGELFGDRLLPPFDFNTFGRRKLYTFLSVAHVHDLFYWILKASPLMLLMAFVVFLKLPLKKVFLKDSYSIFLWICGGLWLSFTLVWHPDFGIFEDWDLFAIAAFPLTLLVLDHWIDQKWIQDWKVMVAIVIISFIPTWMDIVQAARLGHRGRGNLRIVFLENPHEWTGITLDGHRISERTYYILEGEHHLKIISIERRQVVNRLVRIQPGEWTEYILDWSKASLDRLNDS